MESIGGRAGKLMKILFIFLLIILIISVGFFIIKINQSKTALESIAGQVTGKISQVDRFMKNGEIKLDRLNNLIESIDRRIK